MPDPFWTEAVRLTTSGLLVAVIAVPAALIARRLRPRNERLLPAWYPWHVPWYGYEVIVAFFMVTLFIPLFMGELLTRAGFFHLVYGADFPLSPPQPPPEGANWLTVRVHEIAAARAKEADMLRMLWANLFSLPIWLFLMWGAARLLYSQWQPSLAGTGSTAGKIMLGVVAWLAITPVILLLNALINAIAVQLGTPPDQHSLQQLGNRTLVDQLLFLFEACVGAPIREEVLFRGLLLAWCIGRFRICGTGQQVHLDLRPWLVMLVAMMLASLHFNRTAAPLIFSVVLAIGLAAIWRGTRGNMRRLRAIYATAALFAIVHANVWPTPIPLFAFGLILGWLAVRTRGVLVPIIVHALFNAVSAVFVLRGGT